MRRPTPISPRAIQIGIATLATVVPALAHAHERWVKHECQPFDHAFFHAMSGDVLQYSALATFAFASMIASWYLIAVPLSEWLSREAPEAARRRPRWLALARGATLFFLDAENDSRFMERGERAAAWCFAKIPAAVLALGVYQRWLVMPSFPVAGRTGDLLLGVEVMLAIWVASGLFQRALAGTLVALFGYLCFAYGIAAIDAIPLLGSAGFYFFSTGDTEVNPRQLASIRFSLAVGVFLLGLINKVYSAELFIGVGDSYPQLIEGARHIIPHLSRESWAFTTALGEMTFGLLLLIGLFDKLTTLALSLILTNFMFVFGLSEIVHLYPVAGLLVLFFRAPPGTVLDGVLFRAHVGIWRAMGRRGNFVTFPIASLLVAAAAALLLLLAPLLLVVQVLPHL